MRSNMVEQICTLNSCYYNFFISASLSHQALRDTAYALDLSQLDHYNVMYTGAPEYLVKRLQIIINTAARVVAGRSCFSPISGYVHDVLH